MVAVRFVPKLRGSLVAVSLAACSGTIDPIAGSRDAGGDMSPSTGVDAASPEVEAGSPNVDARVPVDPSEPDGSSGPHDAGGPPVPPEPSRPEGTLPNEPYPEDLVGLPRDRWEEGIISPTLENEHHNQPTVINGYLMLAGNARFSLYDLQDPREPVLLSTRVSPDDCPSCGPAGEAEGHQIGFAKYGSTLYTATISGKGIDIWDITDARNPSHVAAVHLEGVNYGDFTEAVWGVAWQGTTIYVGGTNTGLHVLDARDPSHVSVVKRMPTSELGGVSAGPVFPVGNILVVTTPKESGGIATLDISDPKQPFVLDAIRPAKSYIGSFYRHHVYLQTPLRVWDVLSDPTTIGAADAPLAKFDTPTSEYMSFSDGILFLGLLRPNPGALKIDVSDLGSMKNLNRVWGRMDLNGADDQFSVPIGNLLVLSDDQLVGSRYVGTIIAVHAAEPDTTPPRVDTIIPRDGSTHQPTTSRIGLSFTDNIELATVDPYSIIVRPVGGQPVAGTFSASTTLLKFEPAETLAAGTEYEVVIPTGRLTDYVGNGLAEEFRATFTTR
jgi:hypothetical protein